MPVQVTPRWSDYKLGNKGATRVFDVSGVANGTEAYAACPFKFNQQHDENPQFKCDGWDCTEAGWQLYRVSFSFSQPEDGDEHNEDGNGTNPTNNPPRIKWEIGNTSEPFDRDADGKAITNSAGDPFDQPVSKILPTVFLTITRFENAPFDAQKAVKFSGTVNKSPITFEGITMAKGLMLCHSITPTTEYTVGAKFVEVAYNFEIRRDGHKARILDQGFRAWINDSGNKLSELFVNKVQITAQVLLDGTGKPYNKFGVKGGSALVPKDIIANPTVPTNFEKDEAPGGSAMFLKFTLYKEEEFTAMGL